MPSHPLQAITVPAGEHITCLFIASGAHIRCINKESTDGLPHVSGTVNDHKGLVRLLAHHVIEENEVKKDSGDYCYVVSTGEDKMLNVYSSKNPDASKGLELRSSRELVKRANSLQITPEGDIIVGDKFGDVYVYPLISPDQPKEVTIKDKETNKAQPILGHVSMLNALVHVPAAPEYGIPHPLIVTGDRDEHVRVSRFPQGHVIDKYLWGSKKFVSALLYIPASAEFPTPLIVSGGGDATLQVWDLVTGELLNRFPIEELLEPYVVVGPESATPVPAGRRKDKRGQKKGKGKQGNADAEEENGEGTPVDVEAEEEAVSARKAELPIGLAVSHLHLVGRPGHKSGAGVLVGAAGCTALLYVPLELLLGSTPGPDYEKEIRVLDLYSPVLDIASQNAGKATTAITSFLVTLDLTRQTQAPTEEYHGGALQLVTYSCGSKDLKGTLRNETSDDWGNAIGHVAEKSALEVEEDEMPTVSSLYPLLSLLHHPDLFSEGQQQQGDDVEGGRSSDKSKQRGQKRQAESSPARDGNIDRRALGLVGELKTGKRAAGRAEIRRRLEQEQQKVKEAAKNGESSAAAEMNVEANGGDS